MAAGLARVPEVKVPKIAAAAPSKKTSGCRPGVLEAAGLALEAGFGCGWRMEAWTVRQHARRSERSADYYYFLLIIMISYYQQ